MLPDAGELSAALLLVGASNFSVPRLSQASVMPLLGGVSFAAWLHMSTCCACLSLSTGSPALPALWATADEATPSAANAAVVAAVAAAASAEGVIAW